MSSILAFAQRPIAFYPCFVTLAGSMNAGVLLSQLFYWCGAVNGRKFYKRDAEIMDEIKLSEKELRTAKALLKKLPFLTITVEGMPAQTFYDFDLQKMDAELQRIAGKEPQKGRVKNSPKGGTSTALWAELEPPKGRNILYTENTTENTTDIAPAVQSVKSAKFDYKKRLLQNGVSEEDAELFMQARKRKRSVNNERAFNMLEAEVLKSGLTMPQAIALCVNRESPWAGFKADWVQTTARKEKNDISKFAATPRDKAAIEKQDALNKHRQYLLDHADDDDDNF